MTRLYCHSAYLTYMRNSLYEIPGWMSTGIKVAGRNINNLRCADDTTLMAESGEELKRFLMGVKEENEAG